MKKILIGFFIICLSSSISANNLLTERGSFKTKLNTKKKLEDQLPIPPKEIFKIIKYRTKIGEMSAYLSQHKIKKNEKKAAIIWLTGGFPGAIPGKYLWEQTEVSNEQSARIYRQYGIVMMFPTLRGRVKGNSGVVERFYGEVEDVISAAEHLKSLSYIDPKRIYLGGHSTGGTLALLVSESTDIFAGVISLGPISTDYGKEGVPYQWTKKEIYFRAPINFVSYIKKPTYIIEGQSGNSSSLKEFKEIQKKSTNSNIKIASVKNANHFNVIHPVNRIFAKAILESKKGLLNIDIKKELQPAYDIFVSEQQESKDLRILSNLRFEGILIQGKKTMVSSFYSWDEVILKSLIRESGKLNLNATKITKLKNDQNKTYYGITLSKEVRIDSLKNVFMTSKHFNNLALKHELYYNYWTLEK
ncbi:MAG: prolyl oligopeptidase family serine peptidase [Deltaproteobacteria bacterium]|nr:prolyl oligopeptidase family serine peptidase [Deltaproteobacteria bacterium]